MKKWTFILSFFSSHIILPYMRQVMMVYFRYCIFKSAFGVADIKDCKNIWNGEETWVQCLKFPEKLICFLLEDEDDE